MTSQGRRDMIQKSLVAVPGVVSVSLNPLTQRIVVFGSASVDVLEKTIASTGMTSRRPGVESDKENIVSKSIATQEMLDAEARKERARKEKEEEKARTGSFFKRLGRALYII